MPIPTKPLIPRPFVREAYATAEKIDLEGWKAAFTADGIFTDNSIGVTYRGADLDYPVRQYGTAFADMHRELYDLWTMGDTVVVRLALQGTQSGPLEMPSEHSLQRPNGWMLRVPTSSNWRTAGSEIRLLSRRLGDPHAAWGYREPRSGPRATLGELPPPCGAPRQESIAALRPRTRDAHQTHRAAAGVTCSAVPRVGLVPARWAHATRMNG